MNHRIIKHPLRLGVMAFFVASVGAALGFTAQSIEVRWLAVLAFGFVAVAVACGFFAIGWGWYRLAFGHKGGDKTIVLEPLMSRNNKILAGIVIAAMGFTALNYTPALLYFAHTFGFNVAGTEINGVQIQMGKRWVPIVSPGSILEPFFGNEKIRQLGYIKCEGTFSESKEKIVFSPLARPPEETVIKESRAMDLAWGRVYLISNPSDTLQFQHAYIPSHNLLITATSIEAIREITGLSN